MTTIKYYVEPSAFDRGFGKAVSYVYEWTALLIDLGVNATSGNHQCYTILDGHVSATPAYIKECQEITLADFKEIAGGHIANTSEHYLYEGEVVSACLDVLGEGEATYLEFWDALPDTFNKDTTNPCKLVLSEEAIEEFARLMKYANAETMEIVLGMGRVHIVPKEFMDKVKGFKADSIEQADFEEIEFTNDEDIDFDLED